MGLYWYDYKYNPLHFPTFEAASKPIPAHPVYDLAEKAMFVLCPGLLLQVLTIDTGDRVALVMWVVAALLNGPIYYLVGLIVVALMKGGRRAGEPPGPPVSTCCGGSSGKGARRAVLPG